MIIKILCTALLFSILSINGIAQASSLPDHVLPESSYPYWPAYDYKDFDDLPNVEAHPWQVSNHTVDGWDWSLPETLVPAETGLIGLQRISNIHLDQSKFLFTENKAKFPINSVGVLWISWRDLEAVDGVINFEPLKAKILDAKSKNIDVIVRIHSASYSRSGNLDKGDAPEWMAGDENGKVYDSEYPEGHVVLRENIDGISQNYDPKDPYFHKRYLLFVKALGEKLSLQIEPGTLAKLKKGNNSYQQLPIDAEQQSIADLVKAAYVGYASKSVGDEGIGPHGEKEWEKNDAELHVQQRLAAWKLAFNGIEHKVFMGGESHIGSDYGFGTRRGFIEMYLGNLPNNANKPNGIGQAIDNNGYIYVDETVPLIKKGAFNGDENEEYAVKYSQGSDYRFGSTTNSFSYRYFMSSLRALQMRCTYILASSFLMPEMLPFIAQQLGQTAKTSADVWTFLSTSYLKKGSTGQEVKNFERWLYQRDAAGYTTEPAEQMQHAIVMSAVFVGKHYDYIARKGNKIGFDIDDNWHGNGKPLVVKVSYIDNGTGTLNLVYNSGTVSQSESLTGSGNLKTVTFLVDDLELSSMDHNFDFTLESGDVEQDITVSMVRAVIRLDELNPNPNPTPEPTPEPTALIAIASSSIDGNSVTIEANSTSTTIIHIGFYVDDQWSKNIGSAPHTYTFTGLSDGPHDFKVMLLETDGTKTYSDTVTLTINAPEPEPTEPEPSESEASSGGSFEFISVLSLLGLAIFRNRKFRRGSHKRLTAILLLLIVPFFSFSQQNDDLGDTIFTTWLEDPTSTMTVQWLADSACVNSNVNLIDEEGQVVQTVSVSSSTFHPSKATQVCRLHFTNLNPDKYYYFDSPVNDTEYSFRTAPNNLEKPIVFAEGGDVGLKNSIVREAHKMAGSWDPLFALLGGDLAYANGDEDSIYRWVNFLTRWSQHMRGPTGNLIPMLVTIGNHEVDDRDTGSGGFGWEPKDAPFFYSLFGGNPAKFTDGAFANYDFGDYLRIIALDSDSTTRIPAQNDWLEKSLQEGEAFTYVFPAYHDPAYPSYRPFTGSRAEEMRVNWTPLFDKYKVPVVFEHHDHAYKRTYPLMNQQIVNEGEGVVYLGDGSWGNIAKVRGPTTERTYLADVKSSNNIIKVTIDKTNALFEAYALDINDDEVVTGQSIIDSFSVASKNHSEEPTPEPIPEPIPEPAPESEASSGGSFEFISVLSFLGLAIFRKRKFRNRKFKCTKFNSKKSAFRFCEFDKYQQFCLR